MHIYPSPFLRNSYLFLRKTLDFVKYLTFKTAQFPTELPPVKISDNYISLQMATRAITQSIAKPSPTDSMP